jgi:hypothetical protein
VKSTTNRVEPMVVEYSDFGVKISFLIKISSLLIGFFFEGIKLFFLPVVFGIQWLLQ